MRLFGKLTGAIDRYFRAAWLTIPFDRVGANSAAAACVAAGQAQSATAAVGAASIAGAAAALASGDGCDAGQVGCHG